jgi:hypothetical protein
MQIVEVSIIGVRSAVITLKRPDTRMQFVLVPMIHLGTPEFYKAVTSRLHSCQLVVAEGIRGRSATGSVLTLSYRLLRRNRRLGLVMQDLNLDSLGIPVIRPDMTGAQFEKRWRQVVPVAHRLMVWCLVPPFAMAMLLAGSRRMLSRYLALDDLPTREQERQREGSGDMDKILVDERDELLLDALVSIHNERSSEPISVGVVYGAGHIPGVAAALLARLGYRARSAEWLTVFGF